MDYGNTAILARTGADLLEIAAELEKEGLPYLLESRESLVDHPAVKPLFFSSLTSIPETTLRS